VTSDQKKQRKRRYVPHEAAARFKPTDDWSLEDARKRFDEAKFQTTMDTVDYRDCISGMQELPEESIDIVIADPPFGIDFSGKEAIYNRDESLVVDGYREVNADYSSFTEKWIHELPRVLKDTGSAWIFSGWTNLADVLNAVSTSGLHLVNHIIWKYQFGVFTKRKFVTSHYHLLFLVKDPKKYYFNKIEHYPEDVWEITRTYQKGERKNGTKLPTELVLRCIDFSSRPGDLVLDPFMGNGTTAAACRGSYRHFYGFELNKALREIIEYNLSLTRKGEFYTPYSERTDALVERARKKFNK
jgi:site-specific DNA-methyltransferase (adenine-specific)